MVDLFSLALTHALMALAIWRLLLRDDLDRDPEPGETPPDGPPGPRREPAETTMSPQSATPAQSANAVPRLQRAPSGNRGHA